MNIKRNPCVQAIVAELDRCGVAHIEEVGRGNHIKVTWRIGPRARVYFTGASPSDRNAPRNARSDVRRMLKRDGVILA